MKGLCFISFFCLYHSFFLKNFREPFHINKYLLRSSRNNYPFSRKYYETYLKRLNSKNISIQQQEILGNDDIFSYIPPENIKKNETFPANFRIIINKNLLTGFSELNLENHHDDDGDHNDDYNEDDPRSRKKMRGNRVFDPSSPKSKKSENFEIVENLPISFKDIGGYDAIKNELYQCVDLLKNHTKYSRFNVRIPKGLIFEGLPGNGKTLLAKALAGESDCGFIAVSGSEFQEKYIGVGSAKIRELFKLAKNNIPCIIFIDEIDALGRTRSKDGETASAERDNTLNELLVALDGFKNSTGIFVIGATNRADLLHSALLRPGRIDKRIFIGNPDEKTRRAIIQIHSIGKPRSTEILEDDLVDMTSGFSGAQIENFLNEAMLNALRDNREVFLKQDIETVFNRSFVGWQPTEHAFTKDIIDHIAIHEMGHAIVGLLCKHHSNVTKVIINLSAPNSPGYTVFENPNTNIYTREALFEHLMILLAGRIAEEVFYGISVTTGAINDFEEALKLANKMVVYYGMGELIIYPNGSEKYKELIDNEIIRLIEDAYGYAEFIIRNAQCLIAESAELLKEQKMIRAEELIALIHNKYPDIFELRVGEE
jgi:cell division protease FtsH